MYDAYMQKCPPDTWTWSSNHFTVSASLDRAHSPFSKDLCDRNLCDFFMFILALSQTAFMLTSIKILLQYSCETAIIAFQKKIKQITIATPTPSTFEKHLDVKLVHVYMRFFPANNTRILLKWQKHLPKQYPPTFTSRILPISGWYLKKYG